MCLLLMCRFFLERTGQELCLSIKKEKKVKSTRTKGEKWPDTPALQPRQES